MADFIEITAPKIQSVVFTPNPAKTGDAVTVSVVVEEVVIKTLYPTIYAAGEIVCGEI